MNKTRGAPLRRYFFGGLAVGAPIVLTLWITWVAITTIDRWVLGMIPDSEAVPAWLRGDVPCAGLIIFLGSTLVLGTLARGLVGRLIVGTWTRLFRTVPFVGSIYDTLRQLVETVVGREDPRFSAACMVEFPHRGAWVIGFVSSQAVGEVARIAAGQVPDREAEAAQGSSGEGGEGAVSVFVPTTPNPTSGFLIFVPRDEIVALDMGVQDAVKLVISAGIVYPQPPEGNETTG